MGLCRLPRTVCESVRERWRGLFADAGYLVTPMLEHMLARKVDAPDFGASRKRWWECAQGGAKSVCESIAERWHDVAGSWLTFSFRSHRCLHACSRGWWARQIFEHQKRWCDGASGGAQSARVLESDGATARAVCRPWVTGHTETCSHLGASGGHDICHREQVLGLCRWRRTVSAKVGERWRDGAGSLPILGFNPMHARMLAREVYVPDFRLSRNGDGTVPAAAHSLRECRAAMARRRGQFADLGLSGH